MAMGLKISDSMDELLSWIVDQPCNCITLGYAVDETTYSRETIRDNLNMLEAAGNATKVHDTTALWRLETDPRTEDLDGE